MRTLARVVLAIIATSVTAACNVPTLRGCVLDEITSDPNLDYTAVMPSDCPVPLGSVGEEKFIGANVIDYNPDFATNYREVKITVRNSGDAVKGTNTALFKFYNGPGRRAQPLVFFPAATGYSGSVTNGQLLPASAKDKGKFEAFKQSGALASAARLHVEYIGSVLTASISGPDLPLSNQDATWYASAAGGTPPYVFQWYRNGSAVWTGSSYTANVGTSEFGLRLIVTDQTSSSRWTDLWVDVDGVRASVSGPTLIYYSEGNATWTVSVRGGYEPYSIDWYFDNMNGQITWQGSGTSLTTYPSVQGSYLVFATVVDSHGTSTTSTGILFTAIGDGQGGCVPEPPAITCN